MKAPRLLLSCLLALFLSACGAAGPSANIEPTPEPVPHGKLPKTITVDGIQRQAVYYVPNSIERSRPVPVVFALHGSGGTGDRFYDVSGWVEKADAEGFIVVFPTALTYCVGDDQNFDGRIDDSEFGVTTKWSAGLLGTGLQPLCTDGQIARLPLVDQVKIESRTAGDDLSFFDAIVQSLTASLPVDRKRLYVSGFSNGAEMAGRLLIERTNTFAAFAMAAGAPVVRGPALRPAAVAFSVGSDDERFLQALRRSALPLDPSFLDIPALHEIVSRIAGAVQLDDSVYRFGSQQLDGTGFSTFTYDTSLSGAHNQLVVVVIDGATHEYPNGRNHPLAMADLLWPFFQQYALP